MNKIGRCWKHDYRSPGIYLITIRKHPSLPDFGYIVGDCRIPPGVPGCAEVRYTRMGSDVNREIWRLPMIDGRLKVLQHRVMPDHVHIVLRVLGRLDEHVGKYIARFESRLKGYFEAGYNDQILTKDRSLAVMINYVRENPHRLAVMRCHPEFFRRVRNITTADMQLEGYGNFFLLKYPLIEPVIVHRAWSDLELERKRAYWHHVASNHGVLVSPFISKAEKVVRDEVLELGGRIIHINPEPFGDGFTKPQGHDFSLCAEGRQLILAPRVSRSPVLTRGLCLDLNAVATAIAANPAILLRSSC
ncbi:MAG: hypothetical protein NC113_00380 [Bacteroides sp.]|nr:hypothetical protein [Bacteroides sp.]MCM1446683.1 hypothetical protein [Bacteroides sp.]